MQKYYEHVPKRNAVKIYFEGAFYHVYNRGVEARDIFLDRSDYLHFLHLLKTALLPKVQAGKKGETLQKRPFVRPRKNFNQEITLHCYCLMPNHFHLLVQQQGSRSVAGLIQSIGTAYSMYFNSKYDRVGKLFEGVFKAANVDSENYIYWLTRYIHRNPSNFQNYAYSSYDDFLGRRHTTWLNTEFILKVFSADKTKSHLNYQQFVEDEEMEDPLGLESLVLE